MSGCRVAFRSASVLFVLCLLFLSLGGPAVEARTFLIPGAITINGTFPDWGTPAGPTSGVYLHQDLTNNGETDGSGFNGTAADLNYFWNALSTQSGGNIAASASNLIQNIFYRIDTFSTSLIEPGQIYNIQLNLGVAGAGKADHLLQIWVKDTATPKVTLVMYSYNAPYPAIGAFTSGSIVGRVSNVASPYPGYSGAVDSSAVGAYGKYDATHYGIEIRIPVSWFGSSYGGLIKNDGSGALTYYGVIFSSTGTLGAVGTVKDTMGDSSGTPLYFIVDTVTGDTYPETYQLVNILAYKSVSVYTDLLPTGASPGDILLYTVNVTNPGPNAARGVVFQDTITDPNLIWMDNVTTTSGTITSGNAPGDNGCTVNLGNMAVDAAATISFRAQIRDPLPEGTTKVTNQGSVSGNNFTSVPTDDPHTLLIKDATSVAISPRDAVEPFKSWALTIDADANGIPSPGDTLTYTIDIENEGALAVSGVVFTDVPDVNSSLVAGSVTTTSGSVTLGNNPGDTSVAVALATLPVGGDARVTFQVIVHNPLPFGVNKLTNQGFVSGPSIASDPTDDPTDQAYDNPTVIVLTAEPLLEAFKRYELTDDADHDGQPGPGDNLTYFIDIVNKGNRNATGVVFSDTLDDNTTLITGSSQTSQGSISSETVTGLTVDIGTIPGGGYGVSISFKVNIDPAASGGLYNQGLVTATGLEPVPTDDPNTHTIGDPTYTALALGPPELHVSKSAILAIDADANNVVSPGDTLQYIVAINNNGGSAADNVSYTDTLDPNTTLVSGSTTASLAADIVETPSSVAVDIAIMEAGTTHAICLITYLAIISDPFPVTTDNVTNQGLVTAEGIDPLDTDDPNTAAGPDPTIVPVYAHPRITAVKADAVYTDLLPTGPSPGDILLYTIEITNSGTTTARGVVFQDTLIDPNLFWMDNVTTTAGTISSGNTPGDNGCTVNLGNLAVGDNATVTFRAQINGALPEDVSRVFNQGLVSGTNFASVPTDDFSTVLAQDVTATGVSPADVIEPYKSWALTIDADHNGYASPGDTLTYTVFIENEGLNNVSGVVFTDVPDANSSLVTGSVTTTSGSVTEGNGSGDNAVSVALGTLSEPGGSAQITFRVTVNNPLPAGVTFLSNQGFVSGPTIAADPTDDPTDQSYDNPTLTLLTAEPLLEAYKRYELTDDNDHDGQPGAGDNLTYFVDVVNKGNRNATGVIFSDTVDDNTTLIAGSGQTSLGYVTAETADNLTVYLGTLAGGNGSATVSFKVTIDPAAAGGVYNQGRFTAAGLEDVLTDDPNTHTVNDPTYTALAAGPPELRVTKSALLAVDADDNNVLSPGDTLQYIVAINNNGGSAAENVTYTDTLDPNTSLVSGSTAVSQSAGINEQPDSLTVTIASLEASSAHGICLITFRVLVDNPLTVRTDNLTNQGLVTADGLDPIPTDDPNTDPSPDATVSALYSHPQISATKTAAVDTDELPTGPSPGDILIYTITIYNSGNVSGWDTVFRDVITDPYLSLTADNVTTTQGSIVMGMNPLDNEVQVDIGELAVATPVTITFKAAIADTLPEGITRVMNQGTISGANFPACPTDDPHTLLEDDVTGIGVSPADAVEPFKSWALTVDADENGYPSPGDTLTYTVEIENEGLLDVEDVVFSDVPDPHSSLVAGSVTTTSGTVDEGNNPGDNAVSVALATLPGPGGSATITFQVTVNNPLPEGVTQLSNQGFVSGPTIAADPTDDPTDQSYDNPTITLLTAEPLLEAYKRYELTDDNDHDGQPGAGDNLTYIITIVNKGNRNATGVVFSDTVDDNTTLITGSSQTSQGSLLSETADGLSVIIGTLPGGNGSATVSFSVSIEAGATGGLYNQGRVSAPGLAEVLTDDPNTHTINDPTYTALAEGPPELRVTKSALLAVDADDNNVLSPGDTLQYIVAINNNGSGPADNVTFSDNLDPHTTLVSGSTAVSLTAEVTEAPDGVTVEIDRLEAGSAHSICLITFQVTIDSPLTDSPDNVTNQGWVEALNIDPIPTDDPYTDGEPDVTYRDLTLENDLVITKSASESRVYAGDLLTYTIVITNPGSSPSQQVVVTENYPTGFSYLAAVPTPDNGTLNQWTFTSLAAGDNLTITINGSVLATRGTLSNTVSVASATGDPNPENNTASQDTRVILPQGAGGEVTAIQRPAWLWSVTIAALLLGLIGAVVGRRLRNRPKSG